MRTVQSIEPMGQIKSHFTCPAGSPNSFERNIDTDILSSTFMFLKSGIAKTSFANARIGPGIPVPPVIPTVLLDPAISLTRWKNQVIKFLGENPGACPWDEAKKYFSKSLMSISSEYTL